MRTFLTVLLSLLFMTLQAQQVQTSLMSGPEKTNFQTLVVQPLGSNGNFTFTNLAFFQRYHDEEDQVYDDLGVQGAIFYNLSANLGVGPGLYYNSPSGLMSKVMLQLRESHGPLTLMATPGIYRHENDFWGGEIFARATYIQPLDEQVALFAKASMLTTWDRFDDHGRSFLHLRIGPRFSGGLHLGLGYDIDWYTPGRAEQRSAGVFIEQWF